MKTFLALMFGAVLALGGGLSGCATAPEVATPDYVVIDPAQPVARPDRIEVIEFIWLGCPHCADMHPRLQAWLQGKPADVEVSYRPAIFKDSWRSWARLHFALQAMGQFEQRAGAVFEAVQLDGVNFGDEQALLAWVDKQGLDRERFLAAYRSPQVDALTQQALRWPDAYQLRGVPSFVVDGKYLTSSSISGSAPDTLLALDKLIVKARAERAGAH
jgi:protein dithiol oxidoreductase (disulfide-forming)